VLILYFLLSLQLVVVAHLMVQADLVVLAVVEHAIQQQVAQVIPQAHPHRKEITAVRLAEVQDMAAAAAVEQVLRVRLALAQSAAQVVQVLMHTHLGQVQQTLV